MSFDVTTLALAKTYTDQHSGGGGQVQPDWNQNDPTAKNYVKNRTHYVSRESKAVVPEQEITTAVQDKFKQYPLCKSDYCCRLWLL